MWEYRHTDELMHYGVIGMKWGQRRASKLQSKIGSHRRIGKESRKEWREIAKNKNKSPEWLKKNLAADRKNTNRKVAKTQRKLDKINQKLNKDTKKTQNKVAKLSTGKAVTQSFLMGSYGSKVYNAQKARGVSTGKAAVQGVINNFVNNITFGKLSRKSKW